MRIGEAVEMLKKELHLGKEGAHCESGMGVCDVTVDVTPQGEISKEPTGLTVRVMLNHWPPNPYFADKSE